MKYNDLEERAIMGLIERIRTDIEKRELNHALILLSALENNLTTSRNSRRKKTTQTTLPLEEVLL